MGIVFGAKIFDYHARCVGLGRRFFVLTFVMADIIGESGFSFP